MKQRRPTTPIDDLWRTTSTAASRGSRRTPESLERRQLANCSGGETLPDDQRTVVVLSDIEGLSYDEIAAVTSVSLGTVVRLSRARAKLRDYLLERRELLPGRFRLMDSG